MSQKKINLTLLICACLTVLIAGRALFFLEGRTFFLSVTLFSLGMQTIFYAYRFIKQQKAKRAIATSFLGGFSIGWAWILLVI